MKPVYSHTPNRLVKVGAGTFCSCRIGTSGASCLTPVVHPQPSLSASVSQLETGTVSVSISSLCAISTAAGNVGDNELSLRARSVLVRRGPYILSLLQRGVVREFAGEPETGGERRLPCGFCRKCHRVPRCQRTAQTAEPVLELLATGRAARKGWQQVFPLFGRVGVCVCVRCGFPEPPRCLVCV